jgi:hypothetical protein
MAFEELSPGLLLVRYETPAELAPENQSAILARLEKRRGRVALAFDVRANISSVPVEVPTFWLTVTGRTELQICAMAIITRAVLVRVAARGFSLANIARGASLEVRTFEEAPPGLEWCREQLK